MSFSRLKREIVFKSSFAASKEVFFANKDFSGLGVEPGEGRGFN